MIQLWFWGGFPSAILKQGSNPRVYVMDKEVNAGGGKIRGKTKGKKTTIFFVFVFCPTVLSTAPLYNGNVQSKHDGV